MESTHRERVLPSGNHRIVGCRDAKDDRAQPVGRHPRTGIRRDPAQLHRGLSPHRVPRPAPTRVETNLSLLQQDILNALSRTGATSISELMAELPPSTSLRTVRENLQRLKDLGLVTLDGRTRAARWSLSGGRIREFR